MAAESISEGWLLVNNLLVVVHHCGYYGLMHMTPNMRDILNKSESQ